MKRTSRPAGADGYMLDPFDGDASEITRGPRASERS